MTPGEKGGLDVKFNTYRGGGGSLLFHSFLQTDKFMNAKVF